MVPEFGQDIVIELPLEWYDQFGKAFRRDPFPGVEFRVLGCEVDIAVLAGEAHREPFLALAAIAAAPHPAELHPQLFGHVVMQPAAALAEDLGLVGADLLLELAQGRPARGL